MKIGTILVLVASILTAFCQEYVSKYHSNGTAASVTFDGRLQPARVISLDVTSDKAASLLLWRYGAEATTIAKAATATASNVMTFDSGLASNNIVLVQTAAGVVQKLTVWGVSTNTNAVVSLGRVLGTNLAAGDTFSIKLNSTNMITQIATARTNETNILVSGVSILASNDVMAAQVGSTVYRGVVWGVSTKTNAVVTLSGVTGTDLLAGDSVRRILTNYAEIAATIALDSTNLHVTTTNGIPGGGVVLVKSAAGPMVVRSINNVTTTNIHIASALGFALAAGDRVILTTNSWTVGMPEVAGSRTFMMDCSTNQATNAHEIVVTPTSGPPWLGTVSGVPVLTNLYRMILTNAPSQMLFAGTAWFKLTNTYTLTLPALRTDYEVAITNSSGLTEGTDVLISPATGGFFLNTFLGTRSNVVNTVTFGSTNTIAFSAGDMIYKTVLQSTPVGSATLRVQGDGIFFAPAGRPMEASIDGTSSCRINNITVKYQ
jgi:hypothetical protein